MMAIKTNKEYSALLHEIEQGNGAIRGIEDRVLELMEEEEKRGEELASLEREVELARGRLEEQRKEASVATAGLVMDAAYRELAEETGLQPPHEAFELADLRGRYVLLFFYPLDFTFVCPSEIIAFDKELAKFKERNCEVIGVSVDSHFTHLAWKETPRDVFMARQRKTLVVCSAFAYPVVPHLARTLGFDVRFADIELATGLSNVNHVDSDRVVTVTADAVGRSAAAAPIWAASWPSNGA